VTHSVGFVTETVITVSLRLRPARAVAIPTAQLSHPAWRPEATPH
jgi:hypothetical protein